MEVMEVMGNTSDVDEAARPLAYITCITYITNCVARTSVYLNLYCLPARRAL